MLDPVHEAAVVQCRYKLQCHFFVVQWALPKEDSARCWGIKYSYRRGGLFNRTTGGIHSPTESHSISWPHRGLRTDEVYLCSTWASRQPPQIPWSWPIHCNVNVWWGEWVMSGFARYRVILFFFVIFCNSFHSSLPALICPVQALGAVKGTI